MTIAITKNINWPHSSQADGRNEKYLGSSSGSPLRNGCINIERIAFEVHQILSLELQPVCSVTKVLES